MLQDKTLMQLFDAIVQVPVAGFNIPLYYICDCEVAHSLEIIY